MKFLLNILPAICFFLTYKLTNNDLIWATGAIIISTLVAFIINYILYRSISRFQIILVAVLLIFALPTIFLNDTNIIKLKVSVVNIAIACILLVIQFGFKKNIVEAISGVKTPIPMALWKKATILTTFYLFLCAGINYLLAFKLPELFNNISAQEAENIWVAYKTYGNAILNFIFILAISFWLMNKLSDDEKKELEILLTDLKKNKLEQKNKSK